MIKGYLPTELAKKAPFRMQVKGVLVGVGGSIEVIPSPPALPYTVLEATEEQYKVLLLEIGLKSFVYEFDKQNSADQVADSENSNSPKSRYKRSSKATD